MSVKEVTHTLPLLTMCNINNMMLPVSYLDSNTLYGINAPEVVPKNKAT